MKTILKTYDDICYKKYCSIGFIKCGTSYMRIIGDVVQAFTLTVRDDYSCTINFGIFPLCMPTPVFFDAGSYDLNDLLVVPLSQSAISSKNSDLPEQTDYIIALSKAVDDHLLPIFTICNDCNSSLHELIRMEKQIDSNRQEYLSSVGVCDLAEHLEYRSMFDSKKYYMALKATDWDYVRRYLLFHINFCEKKIEDMNKTASPRQPEIVFKRYAQKLADYKQYDEQLRNGNLEFFRDMLDFNEKQMRIYIKTKYPMLKEN